jgi:hypothetical protein
VRFSAIDRLPTGLRDLNHRVFFPAFGRVHGLAFDGREPAADQRAGARLRLAVAGGSYDMPTAARPESVICSRITVGSLRPPPSTMPRSALMLARPAATKSTSTAAVKPSRNIASVIPSGTAATAARARRWSGEKLVSGIRPS